MIIEQQLIEDFTKVIQYSQNIEEPKVEELLQKWYEAKSPIIRRFFKNKLTFQLPEKITFTLNDAAMTNRLESFAEYTASLLESMGGWDHSLVRYLLHISSEEFYSNTLSADYWLPTNKKIQKGTKIIKSFKYFISDDKLLKDLQNKASEIIQENKVEGYLVFSVHPLDFLSSSENCFNWRSCHSLDGEYRAGNLSYMCDSSTIICYLRSEEEVKLPHFPETVPWNNKKWRMLLHFSTDFNVVFAGRQYPFFSPGALDAVYKILVEHFFVKSPYSIFSSSRGWSHWHNDYLDNFEYSEYNEDDGSDIIDDTYAIINHGIWNIHKIVHDAKHSKHFNDLIRSSCYTKPYYMFEKTWGTFDNIDLQIGAGITCLWCGERIIDGYDSMMCSECECLYGDSDSDEYRTCDCCGIRFHDTNGAWVGEDYVCHQCLETQCFTCDECGDIYYNTEKHWDEDAKQFLCENCYYERMTEDG